MSKDLTSVFPELNDPEWVKDREECWQLALEVGGWKSDYRKKDLDKIRNYFFTGVVDKGLPIAEQWVLMLKMFPIQRSAGYDYYYQQHDFTKEQLEGGITSPLHDSSAAGHRLKEQKAYWDYHLGSQFEKTRTFQTATQRIELEIDEEYVGEHLLRQFVGCFLSNFGVAKYSSNFDYFVSIYMVTSHDVYPTEKSIKAWGWLLDQIDDFLSQPDVDDVGKLKLAQRFHEELERPDSRFSEAVLNLWREHKKNRD